MAITIKDILVLDVFEQAKLLTNQASSEKPIKAVSVTDLELSEDLIEDNILRSGDFFLSTLAYTKRDKAIFKSNIEILIKAKCSGLCITNQYVSQVSDEIIDLCNQADFPLIMIDKDVPYAQIIRRITESIISNQSHMLNIYTINMLLNGNITKAEKNDLISRLNPHFKSCFKVIYINNLKQEHESSIMSMINDNKYWLAVPYINGILAILTFSETDQKKRDKTFANLKSYIISQSKNYAQAIIGVSRNHTSLYHLNEGIKEAIFAANSAPYTQKHVLFYDELGSIRLLIALQNHQELYNYHKMTIRKIMDYDSKYKTSLMMTLEAFVKNDADYKKTASQTNQHENTIRYQINKVKQLLDLDNQTVQFIETISLGLKAHHILD